MLPKKMFPSPRIISALDTILSGNGRALLTSKGTVSHRQAVEKAEHEFEIYRAKQMRELESDFDRMLKSLEQKGEVQE